MATPQQAVILRQERDDHHSQSENAYQAYKDDVTASKNDPNYIVITVDLEKVMFTPGLRNSAMFYLRKLSNYNLGISRSNDDLTTMLLWTEVEGRRGSNEIASCVWKFLTSKYPIPSPVRKLVVWFDRCIGQNNNTIILAMLSRLVHFRHFASVEQKFFETGHSYNVCDRNFGVVEGKLRHRQLEVPGDVDKLIRECALKNPFVSLRMKQEEFLDFKGNSKNLKFPNDFRVTHYHWYRIQSAMPQVLQAKSHHTTNNWAQFLLQFNPKILHRLQLPRAYQGQIPLDAGKVGDLRKILKFLCGDSLTYFQNILNSQTPAIAIQHLPIQAQVPGIQAHVPGIQAQVPRTQALVPGTQAPVPGIQAQVPQSQRQAPRSQAQIPQSQAPLPRSQARVARSQAPVPGSQAPVLGIQVQALGIQAQLPRTQLQTQVPAIQSRLQSIPAEVPAQPDGTQAQSSARRHGLPGILAQVPNQLRGMPALLPANPAQVPGIRLPIRAIPALLPTMRVRNQNPVQQTQGVRGNGENQNGK